MLPSSGWIIPVNDLKVQRKEKYCGKVASACEESGSESLSGWDRQTSDNVDNLQKSSDHDMICQDRHWQCR